jgi:internalin A
MTLDIALQAARRSISIRGETGISLALLDLSEPFDGIEFCNCSLSDLSPLASSAGVRTIRLANTAVTDVSPLATVPGLERLFLYGSPIEDISSLATLQSLSLLNIGNTKVVDLSPLAGMQGLLSLMIYGLRPRSLAVLNELQLQSLNAWDVGIQDLEPIAPLLLSPSFKDLTLDNNPIRDVSLLAHRDTPLGSLNLSETRLTALPEGIRTEGLAINQSAIGDLGPAAHSLSLDLRSLDIEETPFRTLSSLTGLARLEDLTVCHGQFSAEEISGLLLQRPGLSIRHAEKGLQPLRPAPSDA